MASIGSQLEGNEDEYAMVPISLSTPPPQDLRVTSSKDDQKTQLETKTTVVKLRNLVITIKEAFMASKRLFADKLLHNFGFSGNSDRPKAYQVWPGNNVFFFHGRLICGPDPRGLILTTFSTLLSSWIFAMYTAENLPHRRGLIVAFSVILTVIVLVNLFLVSSTDPGIIPRNDQPLNIEEIGANGGPRRKRVTVNGVELKLKYCHICRIFRRPRTSQCAICKRNYRFYLMFVTSALIFFIYIFAFSCQGIQRRMSKTGTGLFDVLRNCPETMALASFSFVAIWFLGGLVRFQLILIAINQTGYENYRQCYVDSQNPFDKGIMSNIKEILFSPMPQSRVDFRAKVS